MVFGRGVSISVSSPLSILGIPAFLAGFRSEAAQTGMDTRRTTEGPADALNSRSRGPAERHAVDMPGSAGAVESR
jgi:hypothetical protein